MPFWDFLNVYGYQPRRLCHMNRIYWGWGGLQFIGNCLIILFKKLPSKSLGRAISRELQAVLPKTIQREYQHVGVGGFACPLNSHTQICMPVKHGMHLAPHQHEFSGPVSPEIQKEPKRVALVGQRVKKESIVMKCILEGPKGRPAKGIGNKTLKVKKRGKFRVLSRYFQGDFRCCQGISGCFQGVFPIPFVGILLGPFQAFEPQRLRLLRTGK